MYLKKYFMDDYNYILYIKICVNIKVKNAIILIDKDIMSAKALILKVPNGTLYVLKSSTRIKI